VPTVRLICRYLFNWTPQNINDILGINHDDWNEVEETYQRMMNFEIKFNQFNTRLDVFKYVCMTLTGIAGKNTHECRQLTSTYYVHIMDFIHGDYHRFYRNENDFRQRLIQLGPYRKTVAKQKNLNILLRIT